MAVPATPPLRPSGITQNSPLKRKRSLSPEPPQRLPASLLLLALPVLLALPPTHPHHVPSLRLSLLAVRRCLQLRNQLAPAVECRAWVAFVELGMKIVGAGLSGVGPDGVNWAHGLESEISTAIGKGVRGPSYLAYLVQSRIFRQLVLSQAHPGLHLYTHHLRLFHARLSHWQHNHKFSRALLRRHIATLSTSDPPAHHYESQLALVEHALAANPVDLPAALQSLAAIQGLSVRWGHSDVALLGQVIRLRALVSALSWMEVFPLLETLESTLGLVFSNPKNSTDSELMSQREEIPRLSALHTSLQLHVLTLGVLAHVQAGRSKDASARIGRLHIALDSGSLDQEGVRDGVIQVPLDMSFPLRIQVTHPRVFFHLAFLVSAVAMRDTAGRRPKPKVFASEGLAACERERPKDPSRGVGRYPRWAGLRERQDVEEHLAKIEADLLCELVGVCIQRSEFGEAEEHLSRLISHARTHSLWDSYSARVTLQHAYLAHGRCNRTRALQCYRAAAYLAANEERNLAVGTKVQAGIAVARFVRVAAQAGEVSLRLGIARMTMGPGETLDEHFCKWGSDVAGECRVLGGTLEAVGRVLQACLTEEIVVAKNNLKASLQLTTDALDNHLRALILALTSSHYLHTSFEYAEVMLTTARQLAAGLGAPASKLRDSTTACMPASHRVGNAALGLWVGERFLELYRRTGRDGRAKQQGAINERLSIALHRIEQEANGPDRDGEDDVLV